MVGGYYPIDYHFCFVFGVLFFLLLRHQHRVLHLGVCILISSRDLLPIIKRQHILASRIEVRVQGAHSYFCIVIYLSVDLRWICFAHGYTRLSIPTLYFFCLVSLTGLVFYLSLILSWALDQDGLWHSREGWHGCICGSPRNFCIKELNCIQFNRLNRIIRGMDWTDAYKRPGLASDIPV